MAGQVKYRGWVICSVIRMAKGRARGQAAFEYMVLIALIVVLVALVVVLLRQNLLVSANEQLQTALRVTGQTVDVSGQNYTPTSRVPSPTPDTGAISTGVWEWMVLQINTASKAADALLGKWLTYVWYAVLGVVAILIIVFFWRVFTRHYSK